MDGENIYHKKWHGTAMIATAIYSHEWYPFKGDIKEFWEFIGDHKRNFCNEIRKEHEARGRG